MKACVRLSTATRLRIAIGAGLLVCAGALCWLGNAREAEAEGAERSVQRLNQFPSELSVGVIGDAMTPLEGVEADHLSGFSGDLLMHLIPQDQVRLVPHIFTRRDELLRRRARNTITA